MQTEQLRFQLLVHSVICSRPSLNPCRTIISICPTGHRLCRRSSGSSIGICGCGGTAVGVG